MSPKSSYKYPDLADKPAARMRFLNDLKKVCDVATSVSIPIREGKSFGYKCLITPKALHQQRIQIDFHQSRLDSPIVTTNPFQDSPHRYSEGHLCMWYPYDPPELRWRWRDGGEALIGHVCAHLIRETWWRQTGEWPGAEFSHSPSAETQDGIDTNLVMEPSSSDIKGQDSVRGKE